MVKSTVDQLSSVQRRVHVEVPNESVNAAFQSAYADLQKKVKINGFRQGKTPINVIRQLYGQAAAQDVAEKLVSSSLYQALSENNISPIAMPVLEKLEPAHPDKTFSFTAIIDVLPKVEVKGYKNLKLTSQQIQVTDGDIDRELKGVQRQHAKRKSVDPETAAASGHLVKLDIHAEHDGHDVHDLHHHGIEVVMGENTLGAEIDQNIFGLKKGERKAFNLTLPKDFKNSDLAGKTVSVKAAVESIEELLIPALDDEFAKDLQFEDLKALREQVRLNLEEHGNAAKHNALENQMMTLLRDQNPFEVPPSMVASTIDDMIREWPMPEAEQRRMLADPELRKSLVEPATRKVQNTLILLQVAEKEQVEVKDDELKSYILSQMNLGSDSPEKAEQFYSKMSPQFKEQIKGRLRISKTVETLISSADIKELPCPPTDRHP